MHLFNVRKKLFKQRRFRQALIICVTLSIAVSFLIVPIEARDPRARITTPIDGLWWALQTMTTVGYGDEVPVTDLGRGLGALMQILGAVLFGVLIAMIGSTMNRSQEEFYWNRLFERLDALEEKVNFLEKSQKYLKP